MTSKFHTLKIKDIRTETDECVSIAFEIPTDKQADFSFKPGQYLNFKVDINGEDIRRSYSLCSAPSDNEWRIAVKQIENGIFSNYVKTLNVNDTLEVSTPLGNFTTEIDAKNAKEYVLIAAGSGITPVMSLAKEILKTEPNSNVTLFYGNKGTNTVIFREELEALKNKHINNFRFVHIFSRENLGNDLQNGRIDAKRYNALWDAFLKDTKVDEVFVCGPEQMILDVKESSLKRGLSDKNVHFELFGTTIVREKAVSTKEIHSQVCVIIDDDAFEYVIDSPSQNVLDAGIDAGADLPYSCKGGVCCTCKAKIVEGAATMDINYALTDEEVAQGYILTCQSHPTTERLIVTFDEN
ncbi:MAG TPA: FAD-binding oxidoreductase [Crocinitomicaceae bacterium]|nr:FAD-binding oxidoreductase [Crocinitomicaceae bacterium]